MIDCIGGEDTYLELERAYYVAQEVGNVANVVDMLFVYLADSHNVFQVNECELLSDA